MSLNEWKVTEGQCSQYDVQPQARGYSSNQQTNLKDKVVIITDCEVRKSWVMVQTLTQGWKLLHVYKTLRNLRDCRGQFHGSTRVKSVCLLVCVYCVSRWGRLAPAPRFTQMVTEGKEAFGLAEILYCCLRPDKRLLIRRLDKHNNTIESDSGVIELLLGRGAVCVPASTGTQTDVLWVAVILCVCTCLLFFFQHNESK